MNVCACSAIRGKYLPGTGRLPFRRWSSKLCAALDLSRGLRVDERNHPSYPSGIPGQTASASETRRLDGRLSDETTLVYCGDAAEVREGFALALQLMGIHALAADARSQSEESKDGE